MQLAPSLGVAQARAFDRQVGRCDAAEPDALHPGDPDDRRRRAVGLSEHADIARHRRVLRPSLELGREREGAGPCATHDERQELRDLLRRAPDDAHLVAIERLVRQRAARLALRRPLPRDLTGEYEYPEDRAQLSGNFDFGSGGFFAQVNYVGEFQDTPDILPIGGAPDGVLDYDQVDTPKVDTWTTLNLQVSYSGIENMKFLLSVDNALDEDPPFAAGDGDTDLYGYVQNLHSPRGRFWSAKAIFNF